MMNFRENEDAVSPVIGVILMVAITVILAAVIAAFAFGMSSNVDTTKTVWVTAALDSNQYLVVTIQGGGDVNELSSLSMSIDDNKAGEISGGEIRVGASFNSTQQIDSGDHVVVVAYFRDGSQQVVLEKFY